MKYHNLIKVGQNFLEKKNILRPKYESILLFSKINKVNFSNYFTNEKKKISKTQIKVFLKKIALRGMGKPLSKIIGKKEFYSREFFVNSQTLDPRPETELIIDLIKNFEEKKSRPLNILDLGTGTGCIIITLYLEFKKKKINVTGNGIDISSHALDIAKKNASYHNVGSKINFFRSNWFSDIKDKFDIIVSNPPYIKQNEINSLPLEVKNFDPEISLCGGLDGLDSFKRIADNVRNYLKKDGFIFVEVGNNQSKEVKKIFERKQFTTIDVSKDLFNMERVIIFKK
ncbi:MAG: protein-(glutamine-N5) methyltransferase, release factor-specific [Rickettsiales bacterium]|nr:protein-(glutamine-N5) methyltransferase, release factor-specific [Rickettsiales bacterium]|tara:strand:- start:1517 stop:2371 length:855 start_codon:yes stop_codon:yes gene_type:complete